MAEPMASQERIERLVTELREVVGQMAASATERTEAAEAEANERVSRFYAAREELDVARARIAAMEAEREGLPGKAYLAAIDENWSLEDELKLRYKNLKPAIAALKEQTAGLEAESATISGPNRIGELGIDLDAQVHQYARVRNLYSEEARPLIEIDREVRRILRNAIDPLHAAERHWGDTLRGIRDLRAGSPEMQQARLEKQRRAKAGVGN